LWSLFTLTRIVRDVSTSGGRVAHDGSCVLVTGVRRVVSVPACAHPFEALSRALSPSSSASSASLLDLGAVGSKTSAFRARLFARWQTDDDAPAQPRPLNERATWLRHNAASVYGDALVACAELDYDTQGFVEQGSVPEAAMWEWIVAGTPQGAYAAARGDPKGLVVRLPPSYDAAKHTPLTPNAAHPTAVLSSCVVRRGLHRALAVESSGDEGASAAGGPVTASLRVGLKADVDAGGGEAFVHEVPWRSPVTLAEQEAKSAVTLKGALVALRVS